MYSEEDAVLFELKFRKRKLGNVEFIGEKLYPLSQPTTCSFPATLLRAGELFKKGLLPESIVHGALKGLLANIQTPTEYDCYWAASCRFSHKSLGLMWNACLSYWLWSESLSIDQGPRRTWMHTSTGWLRSCSFQVWPIATASCCKWDNIFVRAYLFALTFSLRMSLNCASTNGSREELKMVPKP